ncbi:MAG: glutathione metabolism protein [Sneathiella sp.]|nr:MAG: glutathione metabolism protein [Sneathiella sp.]
MHVTITPIFAALLALLFLFLSYRTIRVRGKAHVPVGDGGNDELQRAIRAHGNFIEYVPITLLLLMFLEMREVGIYVMIALGAMLLVGRCVHAYGISNPKENYRFRTLGMVLTFITMIVASFGLLYTYL